MPLKIATVAIDPWWFSAWRVGGGAATLFVLLVLLGRSAAPPPGRAFIGVALAQVAGLVAFSTLALRFGAVATVAALVFTMPLFTAIFALPLLGERLSRVRVGWLVTGACGIALIASGMRGAELIGGALATVAGASWALGNVLSRRAAYRIDLVRLAAWQQLIAALPLIVVAFAFGKPVAVAHLSASVVVASVFVAVVGSGLAWWWWARSLHALPANTVALASFAIPVIGTLSAWAQLHAAPAPRTAAGLAIVVVALCGSVLTARPDDLVVAADVAA